MDLGIPGSIFFLSRAFRISEQDQRQLPLLTGKVGKTFPDMI